MINSDLIKHLASSSIDHYDIILEVTAADYNGESFDGSPLTTRHCAERHNVSELVGTWLTNDTLTVNMTGGTDYARWNVKTPDGIKIAEPGDAIVYKDGTLNVISQPTFTKSK